MIPAHLFDWQESFYTYLSSFKIERADNDYHPHPPYRISDVYPFKEWRPNDMKKVFFYLDFQRFNITV